MRHEGSLQRRNVILAVTSPNTAYDMTIPVVVNNGQITIQLVSVTGAAKLNAFEIY